MPTSKEVANLGLGKIGASRVNSLSPATSPLEVLISTNYDQWKYEELSKRRWVFATELSQLTPAATITDTFGDGRIYKYNIPGDYLRAIRNNRARYIIRGQFIYDAEATLNFEYVKKTTDNELTDPLFINVLASRIAVECAEPATQSPGKKREAVLMYKDAVAEAGKMNAFVLDKDNPVNADDEGYTWLDAREGFDG